MRPHGHATVAQSESTAIVVNSHTGLNGVPMSPRKASPHRPGELADPLGSRIQINETDISRFLINNPDLNAHILIGLAI